MKIFYLLTAFILIASCLMADVDLIIQGDEYWKDALPTDDWTKDDFIYFWKQMHKGEIISVLETGKWDGREIKPPIFCVVTVAGVTKEQVINYLDRLTDDTYLIKLDSLEKVYDSIMIDNDGILDAPTQTIVDSMKTLYKTWKQLSKIKQRKFYFSRTFVDSAIAYWNNTNEYIIITKQQAANQLNEWDVATIRQKIIDRVKR